MDFYKKMSEYNESLLESGHLSDVVLIVGANELRAHKVILSARSPVFAAMFAHDSTKKAQENRVEMVDVDVEVVKLLVRYIYTGKVGELDQYAPELLVAADKYQLDCLKSICEQKLASQIDNMASFDQIIFKKMSEHYESLLKSGMRSDVVLVAGDKELNVHKVILSARSPVFAAMFAHNSTKEAQENRVQVIDVDVEVLEQFLRYIYTGKVESLDQNAVDLFVVADKYQVDCLKSNCEEILLSQISIKTVSDLLIFSDMYPSTELHSECLDFVANNGARMMASQEWKKIVIRADLLAKLFERLNLKYSQVKFSKSQPLSPITIKSVSDLLIMADMHQVTKLITKYLDYITENANQVMATEGWKKIAVRSDLLVKLYQNLYLKYIRMFDE